MCRKAMKFNLVYIERSKMKHCLFGGLQAEEETEEACEKWGTRRTCLKRLIGLSAGVE